MSASKEHKFKVGDMVIPFPAKDGYLSGYLVAGSTYTITKIHENGRVDVEGTFKYDGNGNEWDSKWFKLIDEKEVKVENTCKFKAGDFVVCTEKDSDALEGNFLLHGQSYLVTGIDAYDEFEGCFLLEVQNIETRQPASAYEYRFSLKQETSNTAESLRNSILSLQQERVSLQEKIEQNIAQEKSLTEKLKELGFLLVDETKTVLYAEDIEEDMTDPCNWKVGDVIAGESGYSFDEKPVKIRNILYQGEHFECTKEFDQGDDFKYHFSAQDSKFLYRPVVN